MVTFGFSFSSSSSARVPDPQQAFRAGLLGLREPHRLTGQALDEAGVGFARGPCEVIMLELERLPGLGHWRQAFEAGRALRAIAMLLDQAGAPVHVAREFRENLASAVMTHRMRKIRQAWGGADTIDMFMEMYERVLGADDLKAYLVRQRLDDFVKQKTDQVGRAKPNPDRELLSA